MRTIFMYLENGQKFEAQGHDGIEKLVKRAPNKDFPTTCDGCDGIQYANAILQGVSLNDATRLNFVHMCPLEYVIIQLQVA